MSTGWKGSNRKAELPANWQALRKFVRERAGNRCEAFLPSGARCPRQGTDCDHIGPKDDHRVELLRWKCAKHHRDHTAVQAQQARVKASRARPPEDHPGTVR